MTAFFENCAWTPPRTWSVIETIDMHTGGEPLRVVLRGLPALEGKTVLEKRRYFGEHYDYIRKRLMWEPRGHADMYGAIVTASADADVDAFFLHNEGYSTMCGHAVIALTKLLLESGAIRRADGRAGITINVPAGRVLAQADFESGIASNVTFQNVPSFVYLRNATAEVANVGHVKFDIAFGGAFYAIVEAESVGTALSAENHSRLIQYGRILRHEIARRFQIRHPYEPDLSFLYGVIFTGPSHTASHHSRNVCIFADGELDRSPTGSGVSARAALHIERGDLMLGDTIVIESIVGSTMSVRALEQVRFGPYTAIVPEVGGTAFVTGRQTFHFDPEDPLRDGFILR